MKAAVSFSAEALKVDAEEVAARIQTAIRDIVFGQLRRKDAVPGLSGFTYPRYAATEPSDEAGPRRKHGKKPPGRRKVDA